ncbi:MAG: glycosyltransferase family 4 protein [Candidatus Omnitrophica bacterium]|nr:glycosyltransferase family 4 protein [Candidatus Omnitrophota bacterium]
MKKIKVAQVITRMDWGGSPDVARLLCTRLDPRRFEVTLITGPTRYPSAKTRRFFRDCVGRIICVESLRRQINPFQDAAAYFHLKDLFHRANYDIVHTHTAKAGFLGRWAAHYAGKMRIVHTLHGHNLYGYFNPLMTQLIVHLERGVAPVTDTMVALTLSEKDDLVSAGIGQKERIEVVYQGIEEPERVISSGESGQVRRSLGLAAEERVVSMVGRLEPVKGPGYFIEAALECARRDKAVRFLVVGEGSLRPSLQRRVDEQGLCGRIIFTGWRDDVGSILAVSDIVVLSSLNEAAGMALIEAQAKGIPVVASRTGGIPEVVIDGETGILVEAGNSPALASAINKLLRDNGLRQIMKEKARRWVEDRFSAETMVSRYAGLYEAVMQQPANT